MYARAGKYKLGARAGKYELGVRAVKQNFGARTGGREIQTPIWMTLGFTLSIDKIITSRSLNNCLGLMTGLNKGHHKTLKKDSQQIMSKSFPWKPLSFYNHTKKLITILSANINFSKWKINDVVLVSLCLILNIFHTFF